ncbi:hypothetical protein JB92DRAFT_2844450 [Gautieria morchelliformis]|nr:hypothetical protein JB92DRAFT_2844450 [Gautieria morchelliformis]
MFTFKNPLAASLESWVSRVKCWLRPVHCSFESQGDISHVEQTSPAVLSPPSLISIDIPSPTLNLSFDIDPESTSTASSRCHALWLLARKYSLKCYGDNKVFRHTTGRSISKNSEVLSTNSTTTLNVRIDTLLSEYSRQELVLLGYITLTSDVQDIDDLLLRYPPGFSRVCRCAGMVEDLCEACQLWEVYMEYSRFPGTSSAA